MATPPTFTLYGDTGGGPPVEYTWTRDGVVITNDGSYSIFIMINNDAFYRSTLIVTGILPGVYQYSVNNKATHTSMNRDLIIEGNILEPACILTRMMYTHEGYEIPNYLYHTQSNSTFM